MANQFKARPMFCIVFSSELSASLKFVICLIQSVMTKYTML